MNHYLFSFDKHSEKFKKDKNENSRKFCANLLPKFQSQVLKITNASCAEVKTWEQQFYAEQERHAVKEDIEKDPEIQRHYLKACCGKKLLSKWKIKF